MRVHDAVEQDSLFLPFHCLHQQIVILCEEALSPIRQLGLIRLHAVNRLKSPFDILVKLCFMIPVVRQGGMDVSHG